MQPVGLEIAGVGGHPVEEEGIEGNVVAFGEFAVDGGEGPAVRSAEIGRCQHAGEQHGDTPGLRPLEDEGEIVAHLGHRQRPQRIVGAELEEEMGGTVGQHPIDAGPAAGGGIAGDAGIPHLAVGVADGIEGGVETGGKGLPRRHPVAGDQGIPHDHDATVAPGGGEGGKQEKQQKRGPELAEARAATHFLPVAATVAEIVHARVRHPMIRLRGVELTLSGAAGPVHILKGVDLEVEAGEAVAVTGRSGAGKSSLLAVITGIERATAGSLRVAGVELAGMGEDELARFRRDHVGILFQFFHLVPTMTARENVALPLELARRPNALALAAERLAEVGLAHRLDHYPAQLSGGEQQRVAMARALACEPALLLADEPTGNLDRETGERVIDLLFAARERRGTTLLLVTHEADLAARCERRLELCDGRLFG